MHEFGETLYKKIRVNRLLILAWFMLFFGLLLTNIVGYRFKTDIEFNEHQKFETRCKEIKVKIQTRLAKQKQMLLGGAAMFDASKDVTREEWRAYVNRLSLSRDLDGVQALGFSLWIKPEQLKTHEKHLQKEGFPDYHVKPEGKRDVYTAIIYIEPFRDRNLRAFGYDMYSEPTRHKAMNKAIDNQQVSLSNKIILLQEDTKDVQAGTLMYAPIYQKNKPIDTVEQRRAAIFGWVYSPFRMTDLLRNIVLIDDDINSTDLKLSVYDGNQMEAENLLYQSDSRVSETSPLFSLKTAIEPYGTTWTLYFEQAANTVKKIDYSKVWISMISGSFISLLLFFLLRSYFFMLKNAHRIAFELTKQLREKEEKLALTNADLLQFTTISAHHLQEPSRRLVNFVQRLENELADTVSSNEEVAIALHFIKESAIRQRALVRDIQLYLAATTPRAIMESVLVADILAKVIECHALLIRETQTDIDVMSVPPVIIDRPRLYDVFNILIDNVLRYCRPDCKPKIRIHGEIIGKRIRYYIEDNGIGIPVEYRERVFFVFERLQVNSNQDSTGIGLAIARRIIESCNGSISLLETAGGGTTVVFDLPSGI